MRNWSIRVTGVVLVVATAWYLPWALTHLNPEAPWLAIPFATATLLTAALTITTVAGHWQYTVPVERPVAPGEEPTVLVIIPACGEPPRMVYSTARSVLRQDYPENRIRLVISDDGRSSELRRQATELGQRHPQAIVVYHEPPPRGDPRRRGEAKAGNLNSALALAMTSMPEIQFVETRDADDKVGDAHFLRQVVGQLLADPRLAYVQTIKEALVTEGDPFCNREPLFYRGVMLAKNAANAVFPCGSGLVWRRAALDDIGGFPSWNLVEDLQSGVEALRRGWRGLYLPIVGAVAQVPPEDVANAVKQRGTWALDTMRLAFWGPKRGLSLRQHLHFGQMALFYLFSFAALAFVLVPIVGLTTGIYPLTADYAGYVQRFWPYILAVELFLASLGQGLPYEDVWRSRQTWLGMAPVYAKACVMALLYGPHRKPGYRVTRKGNRKVWHWKKALPQMLLCALLVGASIYHLAAERYLHELDLGSLFWACFFTLELSRTVRNSWHGAKITAALGDALWRRQADAVPTDGAE